MQARTVVAILVVVSLFGLAGQAAAQPADWSCRQDPGNRFYWIERAFCDLDWGGPERAHGIVIWNHGIHGTSESWRAPAAPVLRLLQARGWDVIVLKRHHLAETMPGGPVNRTVDRTLAEAATQRKAGYRKVVLAGQSFGGYITMEAIDSSRDIFAAIALAPGVRALGGAGALDPAVVERIIRRARVERLALVFPKDDALFGNIARGERARPILDRRDFPYLLVDETSEITGHGGGTSGRFALRYGLCLAEFLSAPAVPAGRFTCPATPDEWPVVRELLLPKIAPPPPFVSAGALPDGVGALAGLRWGLLDDSVVLVAPVRDTGGNFRLMYRSTGLGANVLDAVVAEGGISATLPNKATIMLVPGRDGSLIWRSSDGTRTIKAPLRRGRDEP
jgi:pimeloyl-ACP methyl ester carboxylesterase